MIENIRAEYWKYAEEKIRRTLPELYQRAMLFTDRSAFDSNRKNNMLISCIANTSAKRLSVGIYFRKPHCPSWNKERADLILKEKDNINNRLSFPKVKIEPAEGQGRNGQRNDYNILFSVDMDVLDRANWEMCCEFHCKTAKEIYDNIFVKLLTIYNYDSIYSRLPTNSTSECNSSPQTSLDFFALRAAAIAAGTTTPEKIQVNENRYKRSKVVEEYARRRANGICQLCNQPAPFYDKNGLPFLEVHHVKWLSEGGADTIYNTVALCPNCHRKIHNLKISSDVEKLQRIAGQDLVF